MKIAWKCWQSSFECPFFPIGPLQASWWSRLDQRQPVYIGFHPSQKKWVHLFQTTPQHELLCLLGGLGGMRLDSNIQVNHGKSFIPTLGPKILWTRRTKKKISIHSILGGVLILQKPEGLNQAAGKVSTSFQPLTRPFQLQPCHLPRRQRCVTQLPMLWCTCHIDLFDLLIQEELLRAGGVDHILIFLVSQDQKHLDNCS